LETLVTDFVKTSLEVKIEKVVNSGKNFYAESDFIRQLSDFRCTFHKSLPTLTQFQLNLDNLASKPNTFASRTFPLSTSKMKLSRVYNSNSNLSASYLFSQAPHGLSLKIKCEKSEGFLECVSLIDARRLVYQSHAPFCEMEFFSTTPQKYKDKN
jgi:hypothetical protein